MLSVLLGLNFVELGWAYGGKGDLISILLKGISIQISSCITFRSNNHGLPNKNDMHLWG